MTISKTEIMETTMKNQPQLAIIGGSGLYKMDTLKNTETLDIDTPFGAPSSPIITGILAGKRVAFLARHGIGHTISPTEINYRANIFALKTLGVQQVVSISACGSLREDFAPGHIVIPDQIVDFTKDRKRTFFEDGLIAHVSVADPFCQNLSTQVYDAVVQTGATVHTGGDLITIEGPRFSTRGESNLFRSWGMSIIGMTASPEAFLAREAEMCYVTMAHVTDYDVWHISEDTVTVEMVIRVLMKNTQYAQNAIEHLAGSLEVATCCRDSLADSLITNPAAIKSAARKKLSLLVDKYL
jgi:5'-methylthioadenosine phosphorylase